jgi:hypothetical protein
MNESYNQHIRIKMRATAVLNLRKFLEQPTFKHELVFATYEHSEHQVESAFVPIVKPSELGEIPMWSFKIRIGVWSEGSDALSHSLKLYRVRSHIRKFLSMTKNTLTRLG